MIHKDKDASITYPFQIFINNTLFSLLYNNGQGIDKGLASEMYNVTYNGTCSVQQAESLLYFFNFMV